MAAEIPAGRIAGVREECMNASLLHGRIKNKLRFAIFMLHRVVMLDGYAAKRLAIRSDPIAKDAIICDVGDQ